ncbi:MAG: hypothetical protein CME64_16325 [Halobacteriovoraceae bacterium]|nr:hypothetical protein [Halobacteriovoraceae bacterium]
MARESSLAVSLKKNLLKTDQKIASHTEQFKCLYTSSAALLARMKECGFKLEAREELFRIVHTLKGNVGAFYMDDLAEYLHEVEAELASKSYPEVLEIINIVEKTFADVIARNSSYLNLNDWKPSLPSEGYERPSRALVFLSDYALNLSKEANKKLNPISIEDFGVIIRKDFLQEFQLYATHLIGNSIGHGIEDALEMERLGKEPQGSIHISFKENKKNLLICFSDDGRGLDLSLFKGHLVSQNNSVVEIPNHLFQNRLSGSKRISKTSGRGVGVSAFLEFIHKRGGEVKVFTSTGSFCRFEIKLFNFFEE